MCVCALVHQCQLCCFEQKSCQEVKEVGSGSNLRPAKTDKPQQQSCQDASFGTTVSQHTSLEPDLGHSCRSAWANKSDPSTFWTSAVWQELASKFVNQASKCGLLPVEYCTPVLILEAPSLFFYAAFHRFTSVIFVCTNECKK